MATNENVTVVQRLYDAFNRRDFDAVRKLLRSDCEWTSVPWGLVHRGQDEVVAYFHGWIVPFPDGRFELASVKAGQSFAVVQSFFRGTHQGPFAGPTGHIGASGRRVELGVCDVIELRNGKIERARSWPDALTLLRQLGVAELHAPAGSHAP